MVVVPAMAGFDEPSAALWVFNYLDLVFLIFGPLRSYSFQCYEATKECRERGAGGGAQPARACGGSTTSVGLVAQRPPYHGRGVFCSMLRELETCMCVCVRALCAL